MIRLLAWLIGHHMYAMISKGRFELTLHVVPCAFGLAFAYSKQRLFGETAHCVTLTLPCMMWFAVYRTGEPKGWFVAPNTDDSMNDATTGRV